MPDEATVLDGPDNEVVARIKQQYPTYAQTPNDELTKRIAVNYPVYTRNKSFSADLTRMGWGPISEAQDTWAPAADRAQLNAASETLSPPKLAESPGRQGVPSDFQQRPATPEEHAFNVQQPNGTEWVNKPILEASPTGGRFLNIASQDPEAVKEAERIAKEGLPAEKVAYGLRAGAEEFLSGLTSPVSLATIGAAGVLKGAPVISRALSAYFAYHTGKSLAVDTAKELGEEYGKPPEQRDKTKIATLWTSAALNAPLAGELTAHAIKGKAAPLLGKDVALAEEGHLPVTAQVLKEIGQSTPPAETLPVPESKGGELANAQKEVQKEKVQAAPISGAEAKPAPEGTVANPVEAPVSKPIPGEWRVSVQPEERTPEGDVMPGNVQIIDPTVTTEKAKSPTVESLRAEGYSVPDFTQLPKGSYTVAQASDLLAKQSTINKGAENASNIASATKVHGNVQPQPIEGTGQMPVKESGAGVQPRQEPAAQEAPSGEGQVKYRVGDSPQLNTLIERLPQSEAEKANGEQPVRVRNDKTGKEAVVLESDLTAVKEAKGEKTKPVDLDAELRARKLDPSVFPTDKSKKAAIERHDAMISMGGMAPADPLEIRKAQLAQLTDAVKTLAESGATHPAKAFDLGESLSGVKETLSGALDGFRAAGEYMARKLEGKPVTSEYLGILGDRHLALSESTVNARRWVKSVLKAIPDVKAREAISNWVDTGGDDALLAKAAVETKPRYRAGYERARNLSTEEKTVAENLKNYFEARLQEAIDAGILEDGIENYIHRVYEQDSNWRKGVIAELRSGIFTGRPALAKQRVFEYDFEAEKAGKAPVKDFAKRVAAYDLALNKSIADRQAIKAMMEVRMPDGRPMIDVGGGGKVIKGDPVELMPGVEFAPTKATLINRSAKVRDESDAKANRGDYKPYDHPSLRKWKWATNDSEGKPIFVQGDVLVHPDAMPKLEALFNRSAIRKNPVGNVLLKVGSAVKQTILDLSGFHPVQIAVHGTEHRTFKPVTEIDFTNPDVRGLIRGGAVVGETTGRGLFAEGVSGSSLTRHLPWAGERLQAYQSWLFEDYIPRLKMAMGLHALGRNRARFGDGKPGQLSEEQIYKMTADQMNAAFGEQNYEMMGRSKTMQDALRLVLLAPDFLEARSRFVAQALTKYGSEQRNALLLGAATMYITARIMNKILDDEYHFELKNAFNIVHNGRSYSLRTVQGDLIHAITEPGQFTNHRLNPLYGRTALEFATGRDYFGRKRSLPEQGKDIAKTIVPISLRGFGNGQEQTIMESFLNAFGIVTKMDSPSSDISKLAEEWKKKNKVKTAPGEFIYDAEKDPYRPVRLAASRGDEAATRSEIGKLMADGVKRDQIVKHFSLSERHKFTGSAIHERAFIESLTADQKKLYQDSKAERQRIKQTVFKSLP